MSTPTVLAVSALPQHCLAVKFSNGEQGVIDIQPYLNFGVFERLRDPLAFAQVAVSFDTVGWPCGVDLDPVFVYQKSRIQMAA